MPAADDSDHVFPRLPTDSVARIFCPILGFFFLTIPPFFQFGEINFSRTVLFSSEIDLTEIDMRH